MQISSIISLFISLEIYCFRTQSTVNICIAGLNHRAGYATDSVKGTLLKDLSGTFTNWFQQLWLQVQYRKIKSFVICVAYRPPDCHISCFEDHLKPSSTHSLTLNKPVIILGDLNCSLLYENSEGTPLLSFASETNFNLNS